MSIVVDNTSFSRWQRQVSHRFGRKFSKELRIPEQLWCETFPCHWAYLTDICSSTMDLAWSLTGMDRFPEGSWVLAMTQTCGRGQFGRRWDSGAGNLFATLRLPDTAADAEGLLPLAAGLVIAEELIAQGISPQIKWPNDILIRNRKAGGVLIEHRNGCIMAGIGINIQTAPGFVANTQGSCLPPCCLTQFKSEMEVHDFWYSLVQRFEQSFAGMLAAPADLKVRLEKILAFNDEWVEICQGSRKRLACIKGIDRSGGLILMDGNGIETLYSGQIVPRMIY